MTGAMYAAVSGLRTHMSALNVIGNNVSNVNTYGYKSTRYTFNEALYTTTRSGSNGTEVLGGRNPAQIGYGCDIGTIDLDMSTKNYVPTGHGLDCMIYGEGFFMVGDKDSTGVTQQSQVQAMTLSRLGNLEFHDGYLVDGNGKVVYGFPAVSTGTGTGGTTGGTTATPTIGTVLAPIRFPKIIPATGTNNGTGTNAQTVGTISYPTVSNGVLTYDATAEAEKWPVLSSITIDENSGRISGVTQDDQLMIIGYIAIAKVDNPNGVTHVDGRYYQALDGAGDVHVTTIGGVLNELSGTQGGNTGGGNNTNTGRDFDVGSAGETTLVTGGLESSGTDLANEISNMIIVQRGYQANTRIVTVTDSMLEELVNMKR